MPSAVPFLCTGATLHKDDALFVFFTPAPSNILSPPLAVPVTNYVGVLEETSAAECDGVITITVELLNAQTRP